MHNPKIDSNAIENYTSESYPQLFKQVGAQGLVEIQKHDRDAAELVSKLPECDLVEYVGHSNTKSNYPAQIASFVDCKNGKRFYVVNRIVQK